ncbi:MAG TPA: peptidase [Desulfotomaculum sp.]|nr:peptidase [Desulfotomaculum sp.]
MHTRDVVELDLNSVLLHQKSIVIDAHCDTLTAIEKQKRCLSVSTGIGQVDLPRLKRGGVNVQFFAVFVSPGSEKRVLERVMEVIAHFYREMAENAASIVPVFNYRTLARGLAQGKIAALLAVEGGEVLAGRLGVLNSLYLMGVRSLTLTWNHRNELGDGIAVEQPGGLTKFGMAVVKEMNRLGMLVDVAHLAAPGFWDVLKTSRQPVIASHANSYTLCPHPRNLKNEQIKALAAGGGVMGLTFYPPFIHLDCPSLEKLLDHVDYIANLAGVDCIGLGSDFDGISEVIPELSDVSRLPAFTRGLLARGYSKEAVKKILGDNLLRVLKTVIPS